VGDWRPLFGRHGGMNPAGSSRPHDLTRRDSMKREKWPSPQPMRARLGSGTVVGHAARSRQACIRSGLCPEGTAASLEETQQALAVNWR
jgi:hypothetical protein